MTEKTLRQLLETVRAGEQSVDQAMKRLRTLPFEDLGFAKIDHHRSIRCGFPEVIYCEGKTVAQASTIFDTCVKSGVNVLATRASREIFDSIVREHSSAQYHELARTITLRQQETTPSSGTIAIVAAGTSDLSVAEEARITAQMMDQKTETFYDVGVAGIHRLLSYSESLQ